ncbi:uncharacterized protein LOC114357515 [Ostrinia furnacalis]|uniref:uncharacterized protein LOC114357515 n=1 Tax=Ostrinia furnacalis TaxID=93504 RepID=UPI001040150B|nr:uncharacterized protein LOC114357515 [Ostrinia furnacalis]
MEYCKQVFFNDTQSADLFSNLEASNPEKPCVEYDCSYPDDAAEVCGIRQDGDGFRVRLFQNKCQLILYNCKNDTNFTITDRYICNGLNISRDTNNLKLNVKSNKVLKPIIVVDASMFNFRHVNETIDNFFAATHLLNVPLAEVHRQMNDSTRRMMIHIFGPQVVYKPWITIPKNISEDYYHKPTLSSCFHKCPTECPNTYAPVCGVPGIVAREPSMMFQNHCFMDVAQCKMHWEDKSPTAESSAYIESSFMFCLGDEMSSMFRFLPLVRTLQHMGRLRGKGVFKYRVRNMGFLNNMLRREPRLMGAGQDTLAYKHRLRYRVQNMGFLNNMLRREPRLIGTQLTYRVRNMGFLNNMLRREPRLIG